MSYFPSQRDLNLLLQPQKTVYSKIELLNKDSMVVESLEGNMISDSYSIDSTSNIRRSYSLDMQVTDSTFLIGDDNKIWFDKLIRPYVGIYSEREKEVIWYLKGTYLFSEASYTCNDITHTLSLSCQDLMCKMTGDRNGCQPGLKFTIPAGEDIRSSLIGIIKEFGFTKYSIADLVRTVPYDLSFSANATAYEMMEKLMEFCPNYEFFFDLDGTFVVQRLPCYINDIDVLDDTLFQELNVSENNTAKFTAKNCIEVWGKEFTEDKIDRYSETCTYTNNVYSATFDNLSELLDYTVLGIKIPHNNQVGCKIKINDIATFTVMDDYNRPLKPNSLIADMAYIFLYKEKSLFLLGQFQIHAVVKNELSDSRFSVQHIGEEIWEVLSGGDYDMVTSDLLAKERAMYECYYKANLNDSISLTLIDIPWIDVNQKVSYTPNSTEETSRWTIVSVSGDTLSGTCNITLAKFYPDWSEIFNQDLL